MNFTVLGAGSWGTALALHLASAGHKVVLWGRDPNHMQEMQRHRCNVYYLPNIPFPSTLTLESLLPQAIQDADVVLLATPSHGVVDMLHALQLHVTAEQRLLLASKGLSQGRWLHEVIESICPRLTYAVLSGPSFAKEVAQGLPTAVIIASHDPVFAQALAAAFSSQLFRVYTHADMIGVEVGGAVKNVLAVAVGISDGMGFGANARAALMTRGLAEMTRLGLALGAQSSTLVGLSGLGDLMLTCTDNQSRNRRFGLAIGEGKTIVEAEQSVGQVVESVRTSAELFEVAQRMSLDLPIIEQIYHVIHQGLSSQEAVQRLFARALRAE